MVAQPLPAGWWQDLSAEEVFTKAKAFTDNTPCLKTSKDRLINNPAGGFIRFQRLISTGKMETKNVRISHGRTSSVIFNLESGRFFIDEENAIPIKDEFESDDEIEVRIAGSVSTPYEYEMLKPDVTGTNQCLVVRSKMNEKMVRSITKEFQRLMPKFKPEYIRTIKEYYIRKSDGIIAGYIGKNTSFSVMDDRLADTISTPTSIPDEEFLVPKEDKAVAANSLDVAVSISTSNMVSSLENGSQENRKVRFIIRTILCVLVIVPIIWLLLQWKFRRRVS